MAALHLQRALWIDSQSEYTMIHYGYFHSYSYPLWACDTVHFALIVFAFAQLGAQLHRCVTVFRYIYIYICSLEVNTKKKHGKTQAFLQENLICNSWVDNVVVAYENHIFYLYKNENDSLNYYLVLLKIANERLNQRKKGAGKSDGFMMQIVGDTISWHCFITGPYITKNFARGCYYGRNHCCQFKILLLLPFDWLAAGRGSRKGMELIWS